MKLIMHIKKTFFIKTFILYPLIGIFIQPVIPVTAESVDNNVYYEMGIGDTVYNLQELLSRYEGNSTTYQRNILDYQIQALSGTIADESFDSVNSQYLGTLQKIAELNEAKEVLITYRDSILTEEESASDVAIDELNMDQVQSIDSTTLITDVNEQIASIDLQLSQYLSSSSSLNVSVAEARLQEDIADFYTDYQNLITKEAQSNLKNEFIKNCYNLIIYKEQLDYYNSYQSYLDLISESDTIKYKYGLITQITLDEDNANVLQNNITVTENQNTYDAMLYSIKHDTFTPDNSKIKLNLTNTKKQYNVETTTNLFINNNSSYYQILNYIRSYQNYLGSAGTSSYATYHQTELRINDYQLQKKELEDNIRAFVKGAIKSYDKAFLSREASWKELQVKIKAYNAMKIKQEYKRASRLQLQQALCKKEAAEVKYYQSCYEIVVWQDILDNNIYGATP
jgi:hypothetical protein